MKNLNYAALTALCTALVSSAVFAVPQTANDSKPVAHQTVAMKFNKAAEAWAQIIADRKTLSEAIQQGKLSEAHDLVFSIRDSVVTLPYKSDALSVSGKAALAKQVQAVAAIATNIDKYADAGNGAKTKGEFAHLLKALTAIETLYPANALPTQGTRPMSSAEKELFMTPGGKYTAADIQANGNTSVYQKYPGYVASHNATVQKGERICPISETKPDLKLTWIVGGKQYIFCCPPCVAEFVGKSKKDPASIKDPEAYVKP